MSWAQNTAMTASRTVAALFRRKTWVVRIAKRNAATLSRKRAPGANANLRSAAENRSRRLTAARNATGPATSA